MAHLVDVDRWKRWLTSRRGTRCWQEWATTYPTLSGWTLPDLDQPRFSVATDRLQRDLVALAQQGEDDAAVTLLVQLRPGLYRLVRQLEWASGQDRADACDEVRAVFNETLCRHPLDRRPRRVAANLVLDTRQRLDRGRRSDWPLGPVLLEPGSAAPGTVEHPTESPAVMLREAIDRLPGTANYRAVTAEAAYRAWILDQPQTTIAGELGLAPTALARRLHRLRQVVRQELARAA